jgi:tetratricopeptide (TPR) repeat protein
MNFVTYLFSLLLVFFSLHVNGESFLPKKDKSYKKVKKKKDNTRSQAEQEKIERLFIDAQKAKMIEDYETAMRQFKEVIMLDPKNADAHFQLAQLYFGSGQIQTAREATEMAVKLDPTNIFYKEFLAGILSRISPKEAIPLYKELIKLNPNEPDFYMNLAFLQIQNKQPLDAIKTYDQFESVFGLDEEIISRKKSLYLSLNQFDKAMNELKKLEEAYPDEPAFILMQADLYVANNMREKAYPLYKKVLTLDPENPQALLAIADYDTKQGDPTARRETLKKLFSNPSLNIDAKVKMLFPYIQFFDLKKENRPEALELSDILAATHPKEAKSHAIRGDLYNLDNQIDTALASYLRSLELQKDVFNVWQQVFFIYNQKRDWKKLKEITTYSLEYFPNQAISFLFKGLAEYQLKEYEQALKSYAKGEKLSGDNDKLRAQLLSSMGDVFHILKQHEQSDSCFEKALKLDPDNATVLNNYSYYLALRKTNLERARQMSAYANKLQENNDSFLDTYAWILFAMGDYKGAKEWQEKALKNDGENSPTILEHYGDILSNLGETQKALEYWKKAKEAGSDSETLDKKIATQKYIE